MPEGEKINQMFSEVAERYDVANHVLSGGIDFMWRRRLAKLVKACNPKQLADLATGSGDVAFTLRDALGPQVAIAGTDFCQPMLDVAIQKQKRSPNYADITFTQADCLQLPFEDNSLDVITIAFGVRNFEDRPKGLGEMHRVLKPGGSAFVLEFSQPYTWFRPFYYIYLKCILPTIASWTTKKKDAYKYLAGSIEEFPNRKNFAQELKAVGFNNVKAYALSLGIVAIHQAVKWNTNQ